MPLILSEARAADADAIAALHAASWQAAYRGVLPDVYLEHQVVGDRLDKWRRRLHAPRPEQVVLKAVRDDALCGFACLFLDAGDTWGALLDNLHVLPGHTGQGVGHELFTEVRRRVQAHRPDGRMHLWVLEANAPARRFYERQGGRAVEHAVVEILPGVPVPEVRYVWPPPG